MNIPKVNSQYNYTRFLSFKFICLLLISAFLLFPQNDVFAKKKKKPAKRTLPAGTRYELLQDTLLSSGVVYKRLQVTMNRMKHDVHILQAEIENPQSRIKVMKANNNISELSKLQDIIQYFDSLDNTNIKGAVNANFWRAYTNYPIGPLIADGEIVEMVSYKQWSSLFVNESGTPFIDNFKIRGSILLKNLREFPISFVNRRSDTTGIVIYNKFGGQTIPYISPGKAKNLIETALDNQVNEIDFNDSTEMEFDLETMRNELVEMERNNSIEFKLPKVKLEYLTSPAVNKNIYCVVKSIDSQAVDMPRYGCIISYGRDFAHESLPKKGDTLLLRFNTNSNEKEIFTSAVCGTPRLVRNGVASHEARNEGSTGRRFISHDLPRTACGFNKNKTKFYLVTIRSNNGKDNTSGADLSQLAGLMKYIGCYDAMNLDGGGSTIMVLDGKNILNTENPNSSRRISVGLGISSEPGLERLINRMDLK